MKEGNPTVNERGEKPLEPVQPEERAQWCDTQKGIISNQTHLSGEGRS